MTATSRDGELPSAQPDSALAGVRFARVSPSNVEAAAAALVRAASGGDPRAGHRFLQTARVHQIDLTHFWAASDAGRPSRVQHSCLIVPGSGATGMVFLSRPESAADNGVLGALLERALQGLTGVRLAQALLTQDESSLEIPLAQTGFRKIAELLYLRRAWSEPSSPASGPWPEGVTVCTLADTDDAALAEALEASYEATQDCPELHGMRRIEDVLASHRGTGRYDPTLWWVVFRDRRARGALLLNQCPDQDHCELVYLGLGPELRGLGLGRRLLHMGLGAIGRRPHRVVTCAVDARNAPARRLYESEGFAPIASRSAYVRPLVENM